MPCSGCGGSGHNIRTCSQGPTPGGVNGLRASRSSFSSGSSSGIYSSNYSTPVYCNNYDLVPQTTRSYASNNFDNDANYSLDALKDVKKLVQKVDDKFEKQLEKYQEKVEEGSYLMSHQLAQVEKNSRKSLENYEKLLNQLDIAKYDTIKHIDRKFKDMYEKFVTVEKKSEANEQKIEENSKDITTIKKLLVHVINNQEKEERKAVWRENDSEAKGETKPIGPDQVAELLRELKISLKSCPTKEEQFETYKELGMKYFFEN